MRIINVVENGEYRDVYRTMPEGLKLGKRTVVLDNSTLCTLLATPL